MATEIFTADFFTANRRRLQTLVGEDACIIIPAAGQLQKTADEAYTFRQDSNFWYLTGINEPDALLVIQGIQEFLILPERDEVYEIFNGKSSAALLKAQSGIQECLTAKTGNKKLRNLIKSIASVHTTLPPDEYIEHFGFYANPARAALKKKLLAIDSSLKFIDIRSELATLREIKQPEELAAIQAAINVTASAIKMVRRDIQKGTYQYENEVEADITHVFAKSDSRGGHAFAPIVASGERGCILHNVSNDGLIEKGQTVIIDIGAHHSYYASDITRTITAGGKPSARQQAIYAAVLETQAYAISLLKPGILLHEYEKEVAVCIGEKLVELGIIKRATPKSIRKYFPHSTSHFLGLDTHDVGHYDKPLRPGMVLTVEPGIYVPDEAIGVRIEDDVLITPEGCKVLSEAIPKGTL